MAQTVRVKEKYGLVYSAFFPVASEPDNSHPIYGQEIDLGAAVRAYLTINYATAQAYGDDRAQLDIKEFVSAQLDAETLLSDLEVDAKLYGSSYEGGVATDNVMDTAKPGGYAYIQKLKTRTGTIFRAVYLYYTTPSLNADNADTRNASITFMNNAITCSVLADNTGAWRARQDFTSEADAKAWIRGLVSAVSGGAYTVTVDCYGNMTADKAGTGYYTSGSSVAISFSPAPTKLYDNGQDVTASVSGGKYTLSSMSANHQIVAIKA